MGHGAISHSYAHMFLSWSGIFGLQKLGPCVVSDDDASIEEVEMRSIEDYVDDNNENLFSEFDASTCSGDSVHDIF